jgi:predicted nucleic acid-binding protein
MMLAVIDASLVVALLIDASNEKIAAAGAYESLNAPTHLDIECLSALRGNYLGGRIPASELATAAMLVEKMPITRHPLAALAPRIVALSVNATVYDAAYIALAEALDAELLTTDARLAAVPGIACPVRVL